MASEDVDSRPDLQIQVHRPLTWWRASSDQISTRLRDPDLGNTPRWPSYDQDWKAIGSTVNAVADSIAAGNYSVDPEQGDIGVVHVPDTGLGVTEKKIVHAWFRSSAAVTTDPWTNEWSDGRHRTWHTAQANPGITLPVRGDSLGYANPYDIPHLGANWEKMFQHDLERLNSLEWFDRSDPLNAQFVQSLQIAAAGKVPPLVPEVKQSQQVMVNPELEARTTHMTASVSQPVSAIQTAGAAAEGGTAAAIARAVAKHRSTQQASDQPSGAPPGALQKENKGLENQPPAAAHAAEPASKWGRKQAEAIQRRKTAATQQRVQKPAVSKTDAATVTRRTDQIKRDGGRSI